MPTVRLKKPGIQKQGKLKFVFDRPYTDKKRELSHFSSCDDWILLPAAMKKK
jgi:hypothetical protein